MGIPHRAFDCKLIIACLFIITFFMSSTLYANDSLYLVENIEVDATAENSVAAQEDAFNKAQFKAFEVLKERIVAEGDVSSVRAVNADIIASMINDYEVLNEKISAVRYVGTFNFRFEPQAVSKFFSISGVKYAAKTSQRLLLIPVIQKDGQMSIWSQQNSWMQAWMRANLDSGLVPVEVPIGDLDDISDIDDNSALRYERLKLNRMLARYNAKEATIMIATPNLPGQAALDTAKGNMRISIYRTDRGKAEHVKDLTLETGESETVADFYDRAVQQGYKALQQDWKKKTLSSARQSAQYYVLLKLNALNDLVNTRNALKSIPGLSDVSVLSLKPVQAQMVLTYRGNIEKLRKALARMSLALGQPIGRDTGFEDAGQQEIPLYPLFYQTRQQTQADGFYQGPQGHTESNGTHTF